MNFQQQLDYYSLFGRLFMKLVLVVMAAGMGSRYGGLKQIDSIGPNNESIMDYSVYDAARTGFSKVIFIIRRDIENEFKSVISSKYKNIIPVEYAFQEITSLPLGYSCPTDRKKPWGTGHAVLMAKDIVKETFAAINADDFYGRKAFELIFNYLSSAKDEKYLDYSMVGFLLKNTLSEHGYVSRGVCRCDVSGMLENVVEILHIERDNGRAKYLDGNGNYKKLTGSEIVSMNMWGFTPSIFMHLEKMFIEFLENNISDVKAEFYIPSVVDSLIKNRKAKVKVLKTSEHWFGITYKEDKPNVVLAVRKLIEKGFYPEKLF